MVSSCPFARLLTKGVSSGSANQPTRSEPGDQTNGTSKCPFGFTRKALSSSGTETGSADADLSASATVSDTPSSKIDPEQHSQTATCPYGFSSAASAGPKLGGLQCVLCKGFLHRCVVASPCKHKFCAGCIARWQDCPVCGSDINDLTPDSETQGLVDIFLHAHVDILRNSATEEGRAAAAAQLPPELANMPAVEVPAVMPGVSPSPAASFMLQLGMQALRAGNPIAALDRLESCKQELLKSQQQQRSREAGTACADPQSPTTSSTSTTTVQHDYHQTTLTKCVNSTASKQYTPCSRQQQQATASSSAPSVTQSQQTQNPAAPLELPPICGDLGSRICVHPSRDSYSPSISPLLGAVLGSQGDACKHMGALPAAAQLYAASADCLQVSVHSCPDAATDQQVDEIDHSLSVSINKLGDVQYMMQDLSSARDSYQQGLQVRVRRLQRAAGKQHISSHADSCNNAAQGPGLDSLVCEAVSPQGINHALDVVTSMIKVADACAGLGDTQGLACTAHQARHLLAACSSRLEHCMQDGNVQAVACANDQEDEQQQHDALGGSQLWAVSLAKCKQLEAVLESLQRQQN